MPADYHTHTPLCHHAEGLPEAFIAAAVQAGVSEYGISDHAPLTPEPFDDWRMSLADMPKYLDWIEAARESAAPHGLTVRAGLECDWLPGIEKWTEKLRGLSDWDYLIGSVHYIGDRWDFDNPKWLGRWADCDVEEAWTAYFASYIEMVNSGLFDILGHPDLIKKFSFRPEGDLRRFYDPVIESIAAQGSCIELNTAGWHKPCADAYPSFEFLSLAHQAGIPLVISSDAHAPNEVGRDFSQAIDLAKRAGYRETQKFAQGQRTSEVL